MGARFGRYELLRPLGRGGMAELFLARYRGPEGFEKRLVIKRVLPHLHEDRRFLALFFEEARVQVSLSHGNLVPVFDFGRVGNDYFLAMEHVAGRDLGALLATARERHQPLGVRLAAYVGIEVLRALAYVHRRGLVHRDVAPRNVLLSWDGEVKLSDFGVALAADAPGAPGVRGTLAYMAPEQARGERPDGRADLYALGLILAEAVLGRRVRRQTEPQAALEEARAARAVEISGPLAETVARATAPAAADRFVSAEKMQVALERIVAGFSLSGMASHELSDRLEDWLSPSGAEEEELPAAELAAAPAPAGAAAAEDTYFRDGTVDALEELVLGRGGQADAGASAGVVPGASGRRPGRRFLLGGIGAVGLGALVAAGLFLFRPGPRPAPLALPTPAAPSSAPPAARPEPAAMPVDRSHEPGPPVAPTGGARPRPAAARRAPAAGSATVLVRCTPWCVPYVDDRPRGEGSRQHTLAIAAGRHRLTVRRLEDEQGRVLDLTVGERRTLEFNFP